MSWSIFEANSFGNITVFILLSNLHHIENVSDGHWKPKHQQKWYSFQIFKNSLVNVEYLYRSFGWCLSVSPFLNADFFLTVYYVRETCTVRWLSDTLVYMKLISLHDDTYLNFDWILEWFQYYPRAWIIYSKYTSVIHHLYHEFFSKKHNFRCCKNLCKKISI